MQCQRCGAVNPAGQRFCGVCGSELGTELVRCPTCQAPTVPGLQFCGTCGARLASDVPNVGTAASSADSPKAGSSKLPIFLGVGVAVACLVVVCLGAGLVGAKSFLGGQSTSTPTAASVRQPNPTATPRPNGGGSSPGPASTPQPAPTPAPVLKDQYEKGEGPTVNGVTLNLTEFKADIGSLLSQRASLDTTFVVQNDSQQPLQLSLAAQNFTVQVEGDKFNASTINPSSVTVNPGASASIAVRFAVTGGLQKFMNVKDIFVFANQVGPVDSAKWRLNFR